MDGIPLHQLDWNIMVNFSGFIGFFLLYLLLYSTEVFLFKESTACCRFITKMFLCAGNGRNFSSEAENYCSLFYREFFKFYREFFFLNSHLPTNDVLCCLKGFLHLLSESNSSTFYCSLKNIFHSCGMFSVNSLHNTCALHLRFLRRKKTQDTLNCLSTAQNKTAFCYQGPASRFVLDIWR